MSTITAILEPDPDGTLHLPLPTELRGGKVIVEATLRPAADETATDEDSAASEPAAPLKGFGAWKGKIWMANDFDEPLAEFKEYME